MRLTEAGQIALGYADTIFEAGDEMLNVLSEDVDPSRQVLRIGSVATLSRNFRENFFRPLLARDDVELVLQSGSLQELLPRLRAHTLALIFSNQRIPSSKDAPWRCRRIARQPVSLVGKPRPKRRTFRFPEDLTTVPLILPSTDSGIRSGFDLFCNQVGIRYRIRAEFDDMALLRLMTRDTDSVGLVPTVVVQDEIRTGVLAEYAVVPDLFESFYAITVPRRFVPQPLRELLRRSEEEVLGAVAN